METPSDIPGVPTRKPQSRECDLNGTDQFWFNHKGLPFPSVAENIQEELEDYRSREDDIKQMKHEMGVDGEGGDLAMGFISDNTQVLVYLSFPNMYCTDKICSNSFCQRLTSAVSSLPALLEKKRLIDMHTTIATAILEQIKLRKLDVFFELEEKIMSKQGSTGAANQGVEGKLKEVLEDPESGTPADKMR